MQWQSDKLPDEKTPLTVKSTYTPTAVILGRLVACASALSEGFDGGSFGAIVADVRDEFEMSPFQVGFLSGVPTLCLALTAALGGILANGMGRKQALAVVYTFLALGMLIMASADGVLAFTVGRCTVTSAIGAGMTVVSTYLAEITPARTRGFLVSLEDVFLNAGLLLAYGMGVVLAGTPYGWRTITYFGAGIPVLALGLLLLPKVPESPRFLHMSGKDAEAKCVLAQLLDDPVEVQQTIEAWDQPNRRSWLEAIRQTRGRVFIASIGVACSSTLCGVPAVNGMLSLFLSSSLPKASVGKWAFIIMLAKFLPLLPTSFILIEKIGRRKLLLGSSLGMAVGAMITTAALTLHLPGQFVAFGIGVHLFTFSMGMGPAVWPYMSEVLPTDVRGPGVGVALFASRLIEGSQRIVLPVAIEAAEWVPFAFFIYACICIAWFIHRFCPETKGQKLEDITELFTD